MSAHNLLIELFDKAGADYVIGDPGASQTLRVDRNLAVFQVTTVAAEARTLAAPDMAGLFCAVQLYADGGDLTLTVTNGYNQAGDTALTYTDVGDLVLFYSVNVAGTFYWRAIASEGVDLAAPLQQGAPFDAVDTAPTLTIANLLAKLVVGTPTAGRAYTVPTGTLMDGGKAIAIGEAFDWSIANLAAATHAITLTAGDGHTLVGAVIVAALSSGRFRSRRTAANTWITYRLA